MLSLGDRTRPNPSQSNVAALAIRRIRCGEGTSADLPPFMVYHDIVGFDIAVHDAFGVTIIQGLPERKPSSRAEHASRTLSNSNM